MNDTQKKLYEKTMVRLARAGCRDHADQIAYLADEIERYRAKILALETAKACESTAPVMCFCANAYTSPFTNQPEEETTRRVRAELAERLLYTILTAGCVSYESRPEKYSRYTEHMASIRVVMPEKEAGKDGI